MLPVASSLAARVAAQAEQIVNSLTETHYDYTATFDAARGIYDCDCSTFVGFVLKPVAAGAFAAIVPEAGHVWPRAYLYYEFISSLPALGESGWLPIATLAAVERGDTIAWQRLPIERGRDTGHVVIAAGAPSVDADGVYRLRVYDSANRPHFDDTRTLGAFPDGVGSGFLHFKADPVTGAPAAFEFAPGEGFTTTPIAIGRLASGDPADPSF